MSTIGSVSTIIWHMRLFGLTIPKLNYKVSFTKNTFAFNNIILSDLYNSRVTMQRCPVIWRVPIYLQVYLYKQTKLVLNPSRYS